MIFLNPESRSLPLWGRCCLLCSLINFGAENVFSLMWLSGSQGWLLSIEVIEGRRNQCPHKYKEMPYFLKYWKWTPHHPTPVEKWSHCWCLRLSALFQNHTPTCLFTKCTWKGTWPRMWPSPSYWNWDAFSLSYSVTTSVGFRAQ